MTDAHVRRLGKTEMLEILRSQEAELETLRAQLVAEKEKTQAHAVQLENVGSLAQAALEINGVFEAAQKAADQYVAAVRAQQDAAAAKADEIQQEARRQADEIQKATEEACAKREAECEAACTARWENLEQRLTRFYAAHPGMEQTLKDLNVEISILPEEGKS